VTRREHTFLVVAGAIRDRKDDDAIRDLDRGAMAWTSDRTIEVRGVQYTDADCGCVLSWRYVFGERPAHGRVLRDCGGARGHLPHEMIAGAEANEISRDGAA
jgi:hypothetical protein